MNEILLKDVQNLEDCSLSGYLRAGGYEALRTALRSSPGDLVEEVLRSGLRGRGGGGYPTGLKWRTVLQEPSDEKYVVCNAAEGEPGSLKDRYLLKHLPHLVLEGIGIAARAVGAARAYLFINERFAEEIAVCRQALSEVSASGDTSHISTVEIYKRENMGSVPILPIQIEIVQGPDRYLSGEETALLELIQGRPPIPRQKPPYYPVTCGLFGKPTVVNNAETLANVPKIIRRGAEWFSRYGTEESRGTMLFSLSGDIQKPGVYELPFGVSLKTLIEEMGGGIPEGRRLKAVFPGGPSYGLLTADRVDTPLSFEALKMAGSGLGAGCVHLFDETRCMVKTAVRYASFFRDESCGQCPPCQMGTHNLATLLERIQRGEAHPADISSVSQLCRWMPGRGACGLVTGAAISIGSLLHHFPLEFEAHARGERCTLEG